MNYSFIYQKNGYNIKPSINLTFTSNEIELIESNLLKIKIDNDIQDKINSLYNFANKYRENKFFIKDIFFAKVLFRYNKCVCTVNHINNELVTIYDLKEKKVGEVNIKCNRYENGTLYFNVNRITLL